MPSDYEDWISEGFLVSVGFIYPTKEAKLQVCYSLCAELMSVAPQRISSIMDADTREKIENHQGKYLYSNCSINHAVSIGYWLSYKCHLLYFINMYKTY